MTKLADAMENTLNHKSLVLYHPIKIYSCNFLFAFNVTDDELIKILQDKIFFEDETFLNDIDSHYFLKHMDLGDKYSGIAVTFTNGTFAVRVNCIKGYSLAQIIAVIMHEISHTVMNIFVNVGMPHTKDSDEAYCYLLDHITQVVMRELLVS